MRRAMNTALWAVVGLFVLVPSTQAATFTSTMSVGATYDVSGNLQSSSFVNDGAAHIYRIDVFGALSALAANESFGAESFNLTLNGSSLLRNTVSAAGPDLSTPKPNYVANNPALSNIVSASSFTPIPNYFAGGQNMDAGASSTDLLGLLISIDQTNVGDVVDATTHNPVTDPRQSIGVGSPFQMGAVYLRWNGNASASLAMQNLQFSTVNSQSHQFGTVTVLPDVTLNFIAVPEPATLALAVLGGAGLLGLSAKRRRGP